MIRAFLDMSDFDRAMDLYVVEIETSGNVISEFVLAPAGNGEVTRIPHPEGTRIDPKHAFLHLRLPQASEFLRSLVEELSRYGYITPDPYGHKIKAVDEHLNTLKLENDRKHTLLSAMILGGLSGHGDSTGKRT